MSVFHELKNDFSICLKIATLNNNAPLILEIDASVNALCSILKQQSNELNAEVVAAVHSQIKPTTERLWSIGNLELKAVYTELFKFERLIEINHVEIRTDNKSVFFTLK